MQWSYYNDLRENYVFVISLTIKRGTIKFDAVHKFRTF